MSVPRSAARRSHPRRRAWLCLWSVVFAVLVLARAGPVAADEPRSGWSAGTLQVWPGALSPALSSTLSAARSSVDLARRADAPEAADPSASTHAVPHAEGPGPRPTSGAPAPIVGPDPRSLAIEAVRVRLAVHRSGERLPTGERSPRGGAIVDGEAVYQLSRPARAGERLVLLNYAAVMPREPIELDEVAVSAYIDGPFHAGRLDLLDHAAGREVVAA